MENVPLDDLVSRLGQARVARALGVKPASIAKAIRTRRNIVVTVNESLKRSAPFHPRRKAKTLLRL